MVTSGGDGTLKDREMLENAVSQLCIFILENKWIEEPFSIIQQKCLMK